MAHDSSALSKALCSSAPVKPPFDGDAANSAPQVNRGGHILEIPHPYDLSPPITKAAHPLSGHFHNDGRSPQHVYDGRSLYHQRPTYYQVNVLAGRLLQKNQLPTEQPGV